MKKSATAMSFLIVLVMMAAIDATNPQDDSDLVFDDGILAEDVASSLADGVANSRVKREPPPSMEEGDRRGGRHRQLVNGNGSKLSSVGHQHKTKKQVHQHSDDKQVKQHNSKDTKVAAQKKNQVVAKGNLRQLEPTNKKHKRNPKKVAVVRKIDDDDEDMMLGDGSGSGDGENIPLPPTQGGGESGIRKAARCSILIEEPYTDELGDNKSDEFHKMLDRFYTAFDNLFSSVADTQTIVHKFERVSERSLTKVNFDITTEDFDKMQIIEATLRSAIQSGKIDTFFVQAEGFTFAVVGGSDINPIPEPEVCDVPCKSGNQCVASYQRCDGNDDCPDGSDEKGCPASPSQSSESEPDADELDCRGDIKTKCRGPNGVSYCEEHQCDGIVKCPQGDDEEGCPVLVSSTSPPAPTTTTTTTTTTTPAPTTTTTEPLPVGCRQDEFSCDGRCLHFSVFCNGQPDCTDGEDESNCFERECPSGQFKCRSNDCISNSQLCDKYSDCPDGDDEDNCMEPPTTPAVCQGFQCSDGLTCLNEGKRQCDGRADCPDFSDELNCPQSPGPEPCQAGEFQCKNDKSCIVIAQRCDGRVHCQDGSDEIGCLCSKDQWQCDFGSCVDIRLRCDGKVDCPTDESDEANCRKSHNLSSPQW